jgi:aspartyl/asparaginyl beta-hydroxylase (cupin superfamily)
VEQFEGWLGKRIPITVPYSRFINSPAWKELDRDKEKNLFKQIYYNHLQNNIMQGITYFGDASETNKEQLGKKVLFSNRL